MVVDEEKYFSSFMRASFVEVALIAMNAYKQTKEKKFFDYVVYFREEANKFKQR